MSQGGQYPPPGGQAFPPANGVAAATASLGRVTLGNGPPGLAPPSAGAPAQGVARPAGPPGARPAGPYPAGPPGVRPVGVRPSGPPGIRPVGVRPSAPPPAGVQAAASPRPVGARPAGPPGVRPGAPTGARGISPALSAASSTSGPPGARPAGVRPAGAGPTGPPGVRPVGARPTGPPGARPVGARPVGPPGVRPVGARPAGPPGVRPVGVRPAGPPGVRPVGVRPAGPPGVRPAAPAGTAPGGAPPAGAVRGPPPPLVPGRSPPPQFAARQASPAPSLEGGRPRPAGPAPLVPGRGPPTSGFAPPTGATPPPPFVPGGAPSLGPRPGPLTPGVTPLAAAATPPPGAFLGTAPGGAPSLAARGPTPLASQRPGPIPLGGGGPSGGPAGAGLAAGSGQDGPGSMPPGEAVLVELPAPGQATDAAAAAAAFPRPAGADGGAALLAPPPAYSRYNAPSAFVRLSTQAVPSSQALRARWHLPLGAVVQPMAEQGGPVPLVQMHKAGIVRCARCRTYINPFMVWVDGGRSFACNVCGVVNPCPPDYYAPLDANGVRVDVQARPELRGGVVEYVAPQEYMVRAPVPPTYVFVLDVSHAAVSSGALAVACEAIRGSLDSLHGDERTQVAFVTYDAAVHYYSLRSPSGRATAHVVADVDDLFVPVPEDLVGNLRECRAAVDGLLESLPRAFADASRPEAAAGPALQAGFLVCSHVGGKLLLFASAPPSVGIGRVRARDPGPVAGTDREHTLRVPDDPFYKRFAAECSRVHLCVDVFATGGQPQDLASLGAMPKYLGGALHHYPGFSAARDGPRLAAEIRRNLSRETGWEAVMRIRCSKGLRVSSFYGHFFIRTSDLLSLPAVDADKAFGVDIVLEDTVIQGSVAYLQSALLYTASNGERRIRVHTSALPVVGELADLYRAADPAATAALVAKAAVERSYASRLDDVRLGLHHKLLMALREFRGAAARGGALGAAPGYPGSAAAGARPGAPLGAGPTPTGQLLALPASLASLPALVLGISKSAALRGQARDVHPDERAAVGHALVAAPIDDVIAALYPRVTALHDHPSAVQVGSGPGAADTPLPTSPAGVRYLDPAGAYLIDNGRSAVLWLGAAAGPELHLALFGDAGAVRADAAELRPLGERPGDREAAAAAVGEDAAPADPPVAEADLQPLRRLKAALRRARAHRELHPSVFVVRQGTPADAHVAPLFVEDALPAIGALSYLDYAMLLQKDILSK